MIPPTELRTLLHSPNEAAAEFVSHAAKLQVRAGVTWGVPSLDKAMLPIQEGDVVSIVGRPGHGKTTVGAYLAKHEASRIQQQGLTDKECVVYWTFEQSVEEIEMAMFATPTLSVSEIAWGKVGMEVIKHQAVERMRLPVWIGGESLARRRKTPRMTLDVVYETIDSMEKEYKIHPTLVVLDYVQIIPHKESRKEKYEQISDAMIGAKELARRAGTRIVALAQAGRDVDKRQNKIPSPADCQGSSAIEQNSDKGFGIWRPALTEAPGQLIDVRSTRYMVDPTLLVMYLWKQRFAEAGQHFALYFAPELVRLGDMEKP